MDAEERTESISSRIAPMLGQYDPGQHGYEKEKITMNTDSTTNQLLATVVLVLLIILLALLVIGTVAGFFMMGGGMMGMMNMGGNAPLVTGSNGERIFKTGIDVRGEAIQNSMIPGMGGCAMCHGTDGHGGQMMGRTVPCNTFTCLSADGYTEDLIKRAITQGIDQDGHQLDLMMPRWQISESDLNDLISYLKTLP